MERPRRPVPCWLAAAVLAGGCGDEVVGYFEGSSDAGALTTGASSSTGGSTGTSTSSGMGSGEVSSESSGGTTGLLPPGCIADDFENGSIDAELWDTWAEQDAMLEELGGALKLTPPSFGLWDTGVVSSAAAAFPFVDARVRVRAAGPPDPARPVVLFLQILDDTGAVLSIQLAESNVQIYGTIAEVPQYSETFPATPYPAWIAMRAEGTQVHFEISDDGTTFTTLSTRDKLAPFDTARALIMAQTYGEDPLRGIVIVDDYEVCVQ